MKLYLLPFFFLLFFCACSSSRHYQPTHKFGKKELQSDYLLLKDILEKKHPSLYWYTSKDSMDIYFDTYYKAITDSMTELQYAWNILAPLIDKIHCGHTSVSMSKAYAKWSEGRRQPSFPLYFKVWNDTMAVTANLNRKDSVFKYGTLVTSINGIKNIDIIRKMFSYLPEDGQAYNVNFMRLSGNFPYFHRNIFGLSKTYKVNYIDSLGNAKTADLAQYSPPKDSLKKDSLAKITKKALPKVPKEKRLLQYRSLKIDSSQTTGVMTINTFTNGKLRSFFRRSFRQLQKEKIKNLVVDLRLNGGGRVGLSTLLTRYVTRHTFKVADTLTTESKSLGPYTKYVKGKLLNNLELLLIAHKRADGRYHLTHLENKTYQLRSSNNFKGKVYVLTSGLTFSASALFCNAVKGQEGITLVGEETGGGWYGNNGIMIPDIKLPRTQLRVRLPLFRLVQYKHIAEKGSGILPDVLVTPNLTALKKGIDYKMEVVKKLIIADR
ncbi:MAG: S41 family peptidase [Ferruginibacter sp.]